VYKEEAKSYLTLFGKIYKLEATTKDKSPEEILAIRSKMRPLFEQLRSQGENDLETFSSKSLMAKAIKYTLNNFEGLTRFLDHPSVPIDNNAQERRMRSPAIGRKTWYGTHSERGAETTAKLFTIVETCRLNEVNAREYFPRVIEAIQKGQEPFTPKQMKDRDALTAAEAQSVA
jgi:hypothetical protein